MSETRWVWRYFMVLPAAAQAAGDSLGAALDPDSGGAGTFALPLSATGAGSPSHFGASVPATESMHSALVAAMTAHPLGSLAWYRTVASTGLLSGSSTGSAQNAIGTAFGWAEVLGDLGLAFLQPTDHP